MQILPSLKGISNPKAYEAYEAYEVHEAYKAYETHEAIFWTPSSNQQN